MQYMDKSEVGQNPLFASIMQIVITNAQSE